MHIRTLSLLASFLLICSALASADEDYSRPVPKSVTLKLSKATPTLALTELNQQTGINVVDGLGKTTDTISLNMEKTTFWPAIDAIAKASKGCLDLYSRDGRLALIPRPSKYREPPVS